MFEIGIDSKHRNIERNQIRQDGSLKVQLVLSETQFIRFSDKLTATTRKGVFRS